MFEPGHRAIDAALEMIANKLWDDDTGIQR